MPTALGLERCAEPDERAAGTRATLIPDIQGSVIGSQDSGSGALSKIGYLPYGKSASAGPFGYTGQRIDAETNGLYYYRAGTIRRHGGGSCRPIRSGTAAASISMPMSIMIR